MPLLEASALTKWDLETEQAILDANGLSNGP